MLQIQEFEELLSAQEFEAQFEPLNIPLVFRGCVKDWKAFAKWNPSTGGLDYLQELVGTAVVEVMLSNSAPVFYGDIRRHERVQVPFSSFIDLCKRGLGDEGIDDCEAAQTRSSAVPDADSFSSFTNAREQIYLAQVAIMSRENEERTQLKTLQDDIKTPPFLGLKSVSSINLWMNNAPSRSSTHYDPHHNLLCVVTGCKQVMLWPPSAGPVLYPMPIYGEASNHSSVSLESPDISAHPRFAGAREYSQKVVLQAGDALCIPEGWYHQVDSDELTIAVNFWWGSNLMTSMLEHMDAYYLRRILRRLLDKQMNQMLPSITTDCSDVKRYCYSSEKETGDCEGTIIENRRDMLNVDIKLQDLGPQVLHALRKLVSLVHDGLHSHGQEDQIASTSDSGVTSSEVFKDMPTMKSNLINAAIESDQHTSSTVSDIDPEKDGRNSSISNLYRLEDDSIANILWQLEPISLQAVFLAMVHNFPRTLEALVLHLLSPVGAEVVTRKFDELDQQLTEEARSSFYQRFYSVFDDQFAAMDAILNGKESFAFQAFKNVMQLYAGVNIDWSAN